MKEDEEEDEETNGIEVKNEEGNTELVSKTIPFDSGVMTTLQFITVDKQLYLSVLIDSSRVLTWPILKSVKRLRTEAMETMVETAMKALLL